MFAHFCLSLCYSGLLIAQGATTALPCSADTTLYLDSFGDTANGAGNSVFIGLNTTGVTRRMLVKFDIAAALPANARIVTVQLNLNVAQAATLPPLATTVHLVTAPWDEGTANAGLFQGIGTTATAGDCTWLHRNWPTVFWATPGGDFDPTPHGFADLPQPGPTNFPVTGSMVADVQSWLNTPANNFGWLLKSNELTTREVRRLDSRESLTPANRPQLLVTYVLPGGWANAGPGCGSPVPPTLAGGGTFATGFTATFTTQGPAFTPELTLFSFILQQPAAQLFPGCSFHLPFGSITPGLRFLDGAGVAVEGLPIPASSSFIGLSLASQSAVLDSLQLLGFSLSNAVFALVQ
ncbi:MAG: DNRLRE domain-containing protein [Planctomycetota bacterium]|nr:DNRLRE domain-containing protein [Planctomycetota bacterium]